MRTQILILLALLGLTTSCMNYLLGSVGIYDKEIHLTKKVLNQKELVFFGMHHIGTPSFYEDVSKKIDSLNELGYIFYMEGVKISEGINPKKQDTIYRKFRKISGIPKLSEGHLDTINNTLLAGKRKVKFKTKIINQPSYYDLGNDTIAHSIVDVPINKLIKAYEKKYGVISLQDCDFKTPVNLHTDCDSNVDKNFRNEFIVNYRNDFIVKSINEDRNNKIALIYGKMHFRGIKKMLKEQGYKLVE